MYGPNTSMVQGKAFKWEGVRTTDTSIAKETTARVTPRDLSMRSAK
jgi:hypothetical protein